MPDDPKKGVYSGELGAPWPTNAASSANDPPEEPVHRRRGFQHRQAKTRQRTNNEENHTLVDPMGNSTGVEDPSAPPIDPPRHRRRG